MVLRQVFELETIVRRELVRPVQVSEECRLLGSERMRLDGCVLNDDRFAVRGMARDNTADGCERWAARCRHIDSVLDLGGRDQKCYLSVKGKEVIAVRIMSRSVTLILYDL